MSADAELTGGKNYLDVTVFVSLGFSCDTGHQAMFQAMGRADTALYRALFPSAGHQWGGMGHLLLLSTKGTVRLA